MGFTPQQVAILEGVARRRLTVVRAGPGSGKTRVFVEVLKQQLSAWTSGHAGVAALSFTNVAHEVIAERLGGPPPPPHFVGTLDAFLLRFVVLPFWKVLGFCAPGPRLVPEPLASAIDVPVVAYGPKAFEKTPIFRCSFSSGSEDEPVATLRNTYGNPFDAPAKVSREILSLKEREWRKYGRITHGDSHFLASRLLNGPYGPKLLSIVTNRFPVLLVDEFQDTGWFLGRALLALLKAATKGLVVGDPDQAIYQFSGSDRSLFNRVDALAGEPPLLLNETHRCSRRVSAIASALSRSGKQVVPRDDAAAGMAYLVVHKSQTPQAASLLEALGQRIDVANTEVAILTRKQVKSEESYVAPPWGKGVPSRICEAVSLLREGNSRGGASLMGRILAHLCIGDITPTETELFAAGVDAHRWRREVAAVLLNIASPIAGETWNNWIVRTKAAVINFANVLSLEKGTIAATLKRAGAEGDAARQLPPPRRTEAASNQCQRMTIHAAKGREYDVVVVALAKPHATYAPCPSKSWWDDASRSEEREVAYVACSRAKIALCLAVHSSTYEALLRERPSFLALFDVLSMDGAQ